MAPSRLFTGMLTSWPQIMSKKSIFTSQGPFSKKPGCSPGDGSTVVEARARVKGDVDSPVYFPAHLVAGNARLGLLERIEAFDGLFAVGTYADDGDGDADQLLDSEEVFLCGLWEIVP